jgi:site-specific recombinase XerD
MNLDERIQIPVESFLASLEETGRSPATVTAWRGSLHRFFEFVQREGVFNARDVSMELFFAFRKALSAQGVRDVSISRHEYRVIKFYQWLIKKEK